MIRVLDDSHNEDSETMTLTLSNPTGASIADGEAVGTITNTDHMPQAWLARFGRTVADQMLDAVDARIAAPRTPGTALTFAGQRVGAGAVSPEALEAREAEARFEALSEWLRGTGGEDDDERAPASHELSGRDLLTGSSFELTAGTPEGGTGALWGRAAVSRFDGREGELKLDGEITSAMVGADWRRGPTTLGLVLSHSRGEGGYRASSRSERNDTPSGDGTVESTVTGLYPWGRHALSERLTVWGVAGYGAGELMLTPEDQAAIETKMDLAMAAVGGRGVLAKPPAAGGLELAATSDAMVVRTTSDAVHANPGNLAAAEADVTRLRLGLEGTWRGLGTEGGGAFAPTVEIGVRHDGGDAETGFGVDVGAGLAWIDVSRGIRAELRGRGLLTHESDGFSERGFAGTLAYDPDPASERGPSLTLTQTVGASATGGMDALLSPDTTRALEAANEDGGEELGAGRFEAWLGYGWASFRGRYTTTPAIGIGLSEGAREYIHRWRLAETKSSGLVFRLDVEAARLEHVADDAEPEHRVGIGIAARW